MKENNNVTIVSVDSYMEDFLPSLSNFCTKCPLQPTIEYIPKVEKFIIKTDYENLEYNVDPTISKKEVIKDIKDRLYKFYPVINEFKEIPISADEMEKRIVAGGKVNEVLEMKTTVKNKKYKVIRGIHKYNEIDCINLQTKQMEKLKSLIPLSIFFNKLKEGKDVSNDYKFMYIIDKK